MKNVWKSIVAVVGGITLALSPMEAYAATGLNVEYHSINDIRQLEKTTIIPIMKTRDTWAEQPNLTKAPYSAGKVSQQTLQNALTTLNFIRYVAGIPGNVQIKDEYQTLAQAAATVNAVNDEMSHSPSKPAGMSDELYENGSRGASGSNLAVGPGNVFGAIKLWMDDYGIDCLGHRRWCLNPTMGYTGIGIASYYYSLYSFDGSNQNASGYTGVAWPAQNTPLELTGQGKVAWSISFGDSVEASSVHVTMTDKKTGKIWNLSASGGNGRLLVDNEGYGQSGCIRFEPNGVEGYKEGDSYSVKVTGRFTDGKPVQASYDVNFFWGHQHTGGTATCGNRPICSICGTRYGTASTHQWTEWEIWDEPTSVTEGLKIRECKICGHIEEKIIPKKSVKSGKLTLNKKSVTVKRKKTFDLKVKVSGSSKITYQTSDKKVATVSKKGRIKAVGAGTAVITVKAGNRKATCKVTVPGTTKISDIRSSVAIRKGKTLTLKPKLKYIKSKDKITYKSSNSRVASVTSKGKIKAKKKGTAVITVTSGSVKKKCRVSVK